MHRISCWRTEHKLGLHEALGWGLVLVHEAVPSLSSRVFTPLSGAASLRLYLHMSANREGIVMGGIVIVKSTEDYSDSHLIKNHAAILYIIYTSSMHHLCIHLYIHLYIICTSSMHPSIHPYKRHLYIHLYIIYTSSTHPSIHHLYNHLYIHLYII